MDKITDIQSLYRIFLNNRLIDTDTRKIRPDSIFFALKGEHFNGNDFAEEALEKGAAWAVVDDERLPHHPKLIRVNDVLETMQKLAAWHRQKGKFTIIAVTGSNGKTTTKEIIRILLARRYTVQATEGNLNNHIGVPLTLLSMDRTAKVGIVEMGASHPGEILFLCDIARPEYGLITNIGKAHLEGFGSLDGVARAKGELFSYLTTRGKTLFVNQGDERIMAMLPRDYKNVVYYNGDQGLYARVADCNPFLEMEVAYGDRRMYLKTRLIGRYNAENVLAACAVGLTMGIPEEEIAESIGGYVPQGYRSQFIKTGSNSIFMDAYNANPSSMMSAINEFLAWGNENTLLILGEMKEIGDQTAREHQHILTYLKERRLTDVICVGQAFEIPASLTGYRHYADVETLTEYLRLQPVAGKNILIKGSRSNRLEKLLDLL